MSVSHNPIEVTRNGVLMSVSHNPIEVSLGGPISKCDELVQFARGQKIDFMEKSHYAGLKEHKILS